MRSNHQRSQQSPGPRRQTGRVLPGILVAVGAAFGSVFVGATAALAHANMVSGTVSCVTTGQAPTYAITWTISNNWDLSETASVLDQSPTGSTVTPASVDIPASPDTNDESTGAVTQMIANTATGTATIAVDGEWQDGYTSGPVTGTVELPGSCTFPSIVQTTPTSSTIALGSTDSDVLSVTGSASEPVTPSGTATFYVCGPVTSAVSCAVAAGSELNSTPIALTGTGNSATATSPSFTPSSVGTYCFLGVYTSGSADFASGQDNSSTAECFTTTAAATPPTTVPPTTVPPTTVPPTTSEVTTSPTTANATSPSNVIESTAPAVAASPKENHPQAAPTAASKMTAPIAQATTVHTGEPFAGTGPLAAGTAAVGALLLGLGELLRRRRRA